MTIDPTPSLRLRQPIRHAIRAVTLATAATITIASCSSEAAEEPSSAGNEQTTEPTTPPPTTTVTEETDVTTAGMGLGSVGDIPVTFLVPDGWDGAEGWGVIKDDPAVGVIFMEVANTYSDSCPSVALDPPVGPTVDDLASAWADLPAFGATVPTDVTVDGFDGKLVEFTVPDYATGDSQDECAGGGHLMLLEGADTPGDGYWAQGPNQVHQLRIVDVDGTRVVIAGLWFPDTSAEDRADIDEILDSIQIG